MILVFVFFGEEASAFVQKLVVLFLSPTVDASNDVVALLQVQSL